jgi:hypothetical protein
MSTFGRDDFQRIFDANLKQEERCNTFIEFDDLIEKKKYWWEPKSSQRLRAYIHLVRDPAHTSIPDAMVLELMFEPKRETFEQQNLLNIWISFQDIPDQSKGFYEDFKEDEKRRINTATSLLSCYNLVRSIRSTLKDKTRTADPWIHPSRSELLSGNDRSSMKTNKSSQEGASNVTGILDRVASGMTPSDQPPTPTRTTNSTSGSKILPEDIYSILDPTSSILTSSERR